MRNKFINFILTALLAVSVATLPSCSSLAVGAEDVSGQVTAAAIPRDAGGLLGALVAERSGSTSADDDTSAPEETTVEPDDDTVTTDDTAPTDDDTTTDDTFPNDKSISDETTGETETTPPETDDTTGTEPETTAEEPAPKTKQPYKSGDKVVYLTFDDGPHKNLRADTEDPRRLRRQGDILRHRKPCLRLSGSAEGSARRRSRYRVPLV
ncbi:MAG: hypothetical protein V8R90_01300 [Eubacterium sp.]